jgi:hypothetical protein
MSQWKLFSVTHTPARSQLAADGIDFDVRA